MDEQLTRTAQQCLHAAHDGTMDFPTIVRRLMDAGFEGYEVDYRRGTSTYFCSNGEALQLELPQSDAAIAATFDVRAIEAAVREAQDQVADYTYAGFCSKVKSAGCAGYFVSFLGKRVLYFGRTAETHVELFPS